MLDSSKTPSIVHHTLFIVSGGFGVSGEQIARTAMAQFRDVNIDLLVFPHVHNVQQIRETIQKAATQHATIIHTLVNTELRAELVRLAREENVIAIDLIGVLLGRLANVLNREPIGQPGLYRQLREDYFNRVEAIEFGVQHDDGKHPGDLESAEIVLVGPSRVGKTPLTMYLSVQGWKVANVPIIPELPPPEELLQIDPGRIIGLTVDPGQLIFHRRKRQRRLGLSAESDYSNPEMIAEEVRSVKRLYRKGKFSVVDVTDRPIEETAEEIIGLIRQRKIRR
jgi:hypothetical protein